MEPMAEAHEALMKRAAGDGGWTTIRCALGKAEGETVLTSRVDRRAVRFCPCCLFTRQPLQAPPELARNWSLCVDSTHPRDTLSIRARS